MTRDLKERGHSWAYPLDDYTRALEEAGFLIESPREPDPDRPIPNFLLIRAVKRRSAEPSSPS